MLLAGGGAAAAPPRVLLGAPPVAVALVGLLAALGLAWVCGLAAGRLLLGLAVAPALLLLAAPLPGVRALSGPPLLALAAAGAVAAVWASGRRAPAALFFPIVLAVYAAAAVRVQRQVGPQGDEPHYLMVAESLLRDRDLSLERDYAEGRYRAFHPDPLAPHYRVRGRGGEIFSLHAVGLSLLVLPPYALGGYPAASLFMALLAALVAREVRELARAWTRHDGLAEAAGWAAALTPPLIHYAGVVFTEVPAALIVAAGLRHAPGVPDAHPRRALAWAAAVAFLPWLNVRYAPLAAIVFAYALVYAVARRAGRARVAALLAPVALSAAALGLHHWRLYGFVDPRRVYGRRPELSLATLPEGLPGLLLDQEFGLLVYAPWLVLAVPGLFRLWRGRRREAAVALALVAAALATAGSWHMWRGGFNPPGRFLVPVAPVLAAAVGVALRGGPGAAAALALGWSVWTGLSGAWEPRLVHRDRDGTAPLFRARSGAEEWTRLLPGYVLAEPDRHRLALVWAVALAGVALAARRPGAGAAGLAGASIGLMGAAAAASWLSAARTGGRDAVRVVGRPAVVVPGWRAWAAAPARWGPGVLAWGPLYEPHRHPAGVELGSRLPLSPGGYFLSARIEDFSGHSSGHGPAGVLEVRPEGGGPPRLISLQRATDRFEASFDVHPGERAVTLVLRGGGPFLLKDIGLQAQPFGRPAV